MIAYYTPIPAEQRLIDALRSGEFEQGRDALERDGKNCCLGVACRVSAVPLGVLVAASGATMFNGHTAALPSLVLAELGWESRVGYTRVYSRCGTAQSLAGLNDFGFTFDQIADLIEWGAVLREGETC